jgi:hypothetical protein
LSHILTPTLFSFLVFVFLDRISPVLPRAGLGPVPSSKLLGFQA